MSYCRWSSDQHKSDVYVYDSGPFIVTHVACNKRVLAEGDERPEPVSILDAGPEAYLAYTRELEAVLSRAELVPIGLPFDGESFTDPTPAEAAIRLKELRSLGYYVPQFAIDTLLEDASSHG